jgi:hypothetical protein
MVVLPGLFKSVYEDVYEWLTPWSGPTCFGRADECGSIYAAIAGFSTGHFLTSK